MAGSRIPGPLGFGEHHDSIDDGTLARTRSPLHGTINNDSLLNHSSRRITLPRAGVSNAQLHPTLLLGRRGAEVEQLQRLLNARLRPSPLLPVDGNFDSAVQQQVQRLQRDNNLQPSGRVDAATWFVLLKGTPSSSKDAANASIAEWTLQQKFTAALQFTLPKLPMSMRHEFAALINPLSIGIMVGTLVVWAGSHAFGVGEAIDVVLLLAGMMFLGFAVKDVADHVSDFIKLTCAAKTERDLNAAAAHLAQVIAVIGVAAFAALMTKGARRISNARAAPSTPPSKPVIKEPGPKIAKRVPTQDGLHNQQELKPKAEGGASTEIAQTESALAKKMAERKTLAEEFYRKAGFDADRTTGHLDGIDFTKPVELTELKPNEVYEQHILNGKKGNYFSIQGTRPETLGINPADRVPTLFTPAKPVTALRSTTAEIVDTWSDPTAPFSAEGGGTQLFVPDKTLMQEVVKP